ncbi:MAG: HEAT repeat domain-containing protein [Anaerolineae bacterium]|nr:HEAT repeat domain-containing protein [Anaerolineae bacterium]
MKPPYLVLGYDQRDYRFALQLAALLRNAGVRLVVDAFERLTNPRFSLSHALLNSRGLVSVLSPNYIESPIGRKQLAQTGERGYATFAVLHQPLTVSQWPLGLDWRNLVDFTNTRLLNDESAPFEKLIQIIHKTCPEVMSNSGETPESAYLNQLMADLLGDIDLLDWLDLLHEDKADSRDVEAPRCADWIDAAGYRIMTSRQDIGNLPRSSPRHAISGQPLLQLRAIAQSFPQLAIVDAAASGKSSLLRKLAVAALTNHIENPSVHPIPIWITLTEILESVDWQQRIMQIWGQASDPFTLLAEGKAALFLDDWQQLQQAAPFVRDALLAWLTSENGPKHFAIACREDMYTGSIILEVPRLTLSVGDIQKPLFQMLLEKQICQYGAANEAYEHEGLSTSQLASALANSLWEQSRKEQSGETADIDSMRNALVEVAFQLTAQHTNRLPDVPQSYNIALELAYQTGYLTARRGRYRFSHSLIQSYFASFKLQDLSVLQSVLTIPTFTQHLWRTPTGWDSAIMIAAGLSEQPDALVAVVAEIDPYLALQCVADEVDISAGCYQTILDRIVQSMRSDGDNRIVLAQILQGIDIATAAALLIQTMRDGSWVVRQNAAWLLRQMNWMPEFDLMTALSDMQAYPEQAQFRQALKRLEPASTLNLLSKARGSHNSERKLAIWALGELRERAAVPDLIDLLQDSDADISAEAAVALGKIRDHNALPRLAHLIRIGSWKTRRTALESLIEYGSSGVEVLTELAQSEDTETRLLALEVIGTVQEPQVTDILIRASADAQVEVRAIAIHGLSQNKDERTLDCLMRSMNDIARSARFNQRICDIAAEALGQSESEAAKQYVEQWHNQERSIEADSVDIPRSGMRHSSQIVKQRLLEAKAKRRTDEAELLQAMSSESNIAPDSSTLDIQDTERVSLHTVVDDLDSWMKQLKESDWIRRQSAARAIREHVKSIREEVSPETIRQLTELLNDSDWTIRWTGIEALAWIGDGRAIEALIQSLADPKWKVRVAALQSLAELGQQDTAKHILPLLFDTISNVRESAAEALGALGDSDERTLSNLEKATHDTEEFVRLAAVEALARLDPKASQSVFVRALRTDPSSHVRWAAANGISTAPEGSPVMELAKSLDDTSGPYWEQKRICDVVVEILNRIGSTEANDALAKWKQTQTASQA